MEFMNRRLSDDRIEDSDVLLSQSTQKNSNGTNCNDPTDKSGCKYFVMGCNLLVKRIKVTFRKELEIFHLVVASLFYLLQSLPLL